ncbi:MAG: hypothetical protein NTY69_00375 [Methylococcales bacterium]|nr:hypothetical protein [Methylococcales bacterium]
MIVKKILDTIDLNFSRADEYVEQISAMDLSKDPFEDIENIKTIDSFIYRFSKIQDMMGEKLFPAYLTALEEYSPSMPLIDILNKLEKFKIIDSENDWKYFRKLRNILTHEYPDNEDDLIQGIQEALIVYPKVKAIYQAIRNYLSKS